MRAKKIQTAFGHKIFEKGFIPKHGHLNSFWEGSKPLFEIVDIDLDELPEGTILGAITALVLFAQKRRK